MNREDDSENGVAFVPIGRKNRVTFDQEPTQDDNNEIEEEEEDDDQNKEVRVRRANKTQEEDDDDDETRSEKLHKETMKKYTRGVELPNKRDIEKMKDKKLKRIFDNARKSALNAARAELLLTEEAGYLVPDDPENEKTYDVTQHQIYDAVDLQTSRKMFSLQLDELGPYKFDYDRTGRFMAMAGRKGHVAMFDWVKKELKAEIQIKERVNDIKFLHTNTMFAVAQLKHTYIYDDNGTELHCLKVHRDPVVLEFLPYHFLLVTVTAKGFLLYQDVSTGQMVTEIKTWNEPMAMRQNPHNAVISIGNKRGTVSMWTPNSKEPAVKILSHRGPITAMAFTRDGNYMATAGGDARMKIWDLRTYKCMHEYLNFKGAASALDFSQRGLLATGHGSIVEVWKDITSGEKPTEPYMRHQMNGVTADVAFCPYEDILGIGHAKGFDSIVVPGSGEPNIDSFEANPYQNRKQRNETEVKKLLEKLRPDMITLDPDSIIQVKGRSAKARAKDHETIKEGIQRTIVSSDNATSEDKQKAMSARKVAKEQRRAKVEAMNEKNKERWAFRDRVEQKMKDKKRRTENEEPKTVLDRFKRNKRF